MHFARRHPRFRPLNEEEIHPGIKAALKHTAAREWFEAHEGLEAAWREARGPRRDTLQGMIHIVVAFEHVRRGNTRSAATQWTKAQKRLRAAPDQFEGIDLARWRRETEEFFDSSSERPFDPADAARAPQPQPSP